MSDTESVDSAYDGISPDHFYDGTGVPVFKPTMEEFSDFMAFVKRIDGYGARTGIGTTVERD